MSGGGANGNANSSSSNNGDWHVFDAQLNCVTHLPFDRINCLETKTHVYVIITNRLRRAYRLLKFTKDNERLEYFIDRHIHTREEIIAILKSLRAGKQHPPMVKAKAIMGFVRFTKGFYMLVVTKRRLVAKIGPHKIYEVKDTAMISLCEHEEKSLLQRRTDEDVYRDMFKSFDLKQFFNYSHTYDLTNTLQTIMSQRRRAEEGGALPMQARSQFVWNEYLLEPVFTDLDDPNAGTAGGGCAGGGGGIVGSGNASNPSNLVEWSPFVVHTIRGCVVQGSMDCGSNESVTMTVIGRSSKNFAGARYLKRGINDDGHVANHVEVEQIVCDTASLNHLETKGRFSSYVQVRGSVPVHWYHPMVNRPKPPIKLGGSDPHFMSTRKHFAELIGDFGAPIVIMNLLKCREGKTREGVLTQEYHRAWQSICLNMPTDNPLVQYVAFDLRNFAHTAWNAMTSIAETQSDQIGFFACDNERVRMQSGVVRSNCIDCIDRTNLAQFFFGMHNLGRQLVAINKLYSDVDVVSSPDVFHLALHLYLVLGDAIAIQYGGSAQVGAGLLDRGIGWDKIMGIRRLYNNIVVDKDKQQTTNLFIGVYQPMPLRPMGMFLPKHRGPERRLLMSVFSSAAAAAFSPVSAITGSATATNTPAQTPRSSPSGGMMGGKSDANDADDGEGATTAGNLASRADESNNSNCNCNTRVIDLNEVESDYYLHVPHPTELYDEALREWWKEPMERHREKSDLTLLSRIHSAAATPAAAAGMSRNTSNTNLASTPTGSAQVSPTAAASFPADSPHCKRGGDDRVWYSCRDRQNRVEVAVCSDGTVAEVARSEMMVGASEAWYFEHRPHMHDSSDSDKNESATTNNGVDEISSVFGSAVLKTTCEGTTCATKPSDVDDRKKPMMVCADEENDEANPVSTGFGEDTEWTFDMKSYPQEVRLSQFMVEKQALWRQQLSDNSAGIQLSCILPFDPPVTWSTETLEEALLACDRESPLVDIFKVNRMTGNSLLRMTPLQLDRAFGVLTSEVRHFIRVIKAYPTTDEAAMQDFLADFPDDYETIGEFEEPSNVSFCDCTATFLQRYYAHDLHQSTVQREICKLISELLHPVTGVPRSDRIRFEEGGNSRVPQMYVIRNAFFSFELRDWLRANSDRLGLNFHRLVEVRDRHAHVVSFMHWLAYTRIVCKVLIPVEGVTGVLVNPTDHADVVDDTVLFVFAQQTPKEELNFIDHPPDGIVSRTEQVLQMAESFCNLALGALQSFVEALETSRYQVNTSAIMENTFALCHNLRGVDLMLLNSSGRLCFFTNVYNCLFIHAWIRASQLPAVDFLLFGQQHGYNIGGSFFTLDDIKHGILRRNKVSPVVVLPQFLEKDERATLIPALGDPVLGTQRHMRVILGLIDTYLFPDRLQEVLMYDGRVFAESVPVAMSAGRGGAAAININVESTAPYSESNASLTSPALKDLNTSFDFIEADEVESISSYEDNEAEGDFLPQHPLSPRATSAGAPGAGSATMSKQRSIFQWLRGERTKSSLQHFCAPLLPSAMEEQLRDIEANFVMSMFESPAGAAMYTSSLGYQYPRMLQPLVGLEEFGTTTEEVLRNMQRIMRLLKRSKVVTIPNSSSFVNVMTPSDGEHR